MGNNILDAQKWGAYPSGMWLRHLWHFFGACTDTFIHSLGSTWLGFAVNVFFAVGTTAITLYLVRRKHGREAMIMHWKEEVSIALKVGLVCAAILYIPIIFYSVGKAVYEDHESLVTVSDGQRAAIRRINVVPLAPVLLELPLSRSDKQKSFIFLANKTTAPAVIVVSCDGPISQLQGSILNSRVMMARQSYLAAPNVWMFEIDAPPWTPSDPMLITYTYSTAAAPKCSFEAREQK